MCLVLGIVKDDSKERRFISLSVLLHAQEQKRRDGSAHSQHAPKQTVICSVSVEWQMGIKSSGWDLKFVKFGETPRKAEVPNTWSLSGAALGPEVFSTC